MSVVIIHRTFFGDLGFFGEATRADVPSIVASQIIATTQETCSICLIPISQPPLC